MENGLEEMIAGIVEEILRREPSIGKTPKPALPVAYLMGREPKRDLGYSYIRQGPYEAVVIGSLTAWELLQFPNEVCTDALVKGIPVLLCEEGLDYRRFKDTCNRALYARLLAAERQLKQLGVQMVGREDKKLLTAQEVRRRLETGQPITGRLTPLARDLLESERKEDAYRGWKD